MDDMMVKTLCWLLVLACVMLIPIAIACYVVVFGWVSRVLSRLTGKPEEMYDPSKASEE